MKLMNTVGLVLVLLLQSCYERPTRVVLQPGTPPTFSLRGSGELTGFYLEEADAKEQPNPAPGVLWEIVPQDAGSLGFDGKAVEEIGKVTYGIVPAAYKQIIPSDNKPAPTLVEGKYYYFHFSTANAPHAWGYLVIKNGQPEFAHIQGNCIYDRDGKKTKGPCGEPEY